MIVAVTATQLELHRQHIERRLKNDRRAASEAAKRFEEKKLAAERAAPKPVAQPEPEPEKKIVLIPGRPVIGQIQHYVASAHGKTAGDLRGPSRKNEFTSVRFIAMYLCNALTEKSLDEIGRRFGNRDRSTVVHAIKKVRRLMDGDPHYAAKIEALRVDLVGK